MPIDRSDHLYELHCEAIDADNHHCWECHDVAAGNRLFQFFSVRGKRSRQHDGMFCSKDCHDIYHGLKSRESRRAAR